MHEHVGYSLLTEWTDNPRWGRSVTFLSYESSVSSQIIWNPVIVGSVAIQLQDDIPQSPSLTGRCSHMTKFWPKKDKLPRWWDLQAEMWWLELQHHPGAWGRSQATGMGVGGGAGRRPEQAQVPHSSKANPPAPDCPFPGLPCNLSFLSLLFSVFLSLAAELNPSWYCDPGLYLATLAICMPSLNPLSWALKMQQPAGPILCITLHWNCICPKPWSYCRTSVCILLAPWYPTPRPCPPIITFSLSQHLINIKVVFNIYTWQSFTLGFEIILFTLVTKNIKSALLFLSLEESPQLLLSSPMDLRGEAL